MARKRSTQYQAMRYYIQYLLQMPTVYRPSGEPPIFLFSTRRSGSTLLRDMIASQPGMNYITQPLEVENFNPYRRLLPMVEDGQFAYLSDEKRDCLKRYFDGLLSREYVFRSKWRFWEKNFSWKWSRYVVKIFGAKPLIEWFEESFNAQIVYLVRHPVPVSQSALKRRGLRRDLTNNDGYLNNVGFCREHLSDSTAAKCREILATASDLEALVMNWCLENYVPLKLWKQKNWTTLSYERIVLDPLRSTDIICDRLKLPDRERMKAVCHRPSPTADSASSRVIGEQGPSGRLKAWMETIDSETTKRIAAIFELLEIDVYRPDDAFPSEEFDCLA